MDALTALLHEAAELMPDSLPDADRVRRSAEHTRRTHRVVAGAAAAGLLAITAFFVGNLGGGGHSELAPAVPASRVWAPPVGTVFTADPVMPKAGWVAMARGAWGELRSLDAPQAQALNDDKGIVMTGHLPRPLACITDPYTLGADEAHGAALQQPGDHTDTVPASGSVNEYVLWFADSADAQRAFARLRQDFQDCRTQSDAAYRIGTSYLAYDQAVHPPVEEQVTGEITRVPKQAGVDGYRNDVSVARIGGLVVVHEALEAPAARPALTLYALTMYARNRLSPTDSASP